VRARRRVHAASPRARKAGACHIGLERVEISLDADCGYQYDDPLVCGATSLNPLVRAIESSPIFTGSPEGAGRLANEVTPGLDADCRAIGAPNDLESRFVGVQDEGGVQRVWI
jgi:hypothetical protein